VIPAQETTAGRSWLSGPDVGLPGYWYILTPADRLGSEPRHLRLAGRPVSVWRHDNGDIGTSDPGLPLAEHQGYLWAWLGHEPPAAMPAWPAPLVRRARQERRTVWMPASARMTLENSLDFSHSAFVHPWAQPSWLLHGLPGLPPLAATYRSTADGLLVRATLGPLVLFEHRFVLPDRLQLVILPESPWPLDVIVHHVPETTTSCRMEVLIRRRALPWEALDPPTQPGTLLVHRQDRVLLRAQQRALQRRPIEEQHCAADAYTLLMRRIIDAAGRGEAVEGLQPEPKTVLIRI
jgi:hypothetical protein